MKMMTSNSEARKRKEESTMDTCNHLVGYRHTQSDARLVDAEEMKEGFEPCTFFAHCPLCGASL